MAPRITNRLDDWHSFVKPHFKQIAARFLLIGSPLILSPSGGWAMEDSEIPAAAHNDSIMASPQEVNQTLKWAGAAFAGIKAGADREFLLPEAVPFSFTYGGTPSSEFLRHWKRTVETKDEKDFVRHSVQWADPKTQLVVTAEIKAFKQYPAVDWVLFFENKNSLDSPILENVQPLDLKLGSGAAKPPVVLHRLEGDPGPVSPERSFFPFDTPLEPGKSIRMAPKGGRSSNETAFPFFNLQYADRGIITAIGWSGQWAATFDRAGTGAVRMTAGMELTHLLLHPGETIRTPRIVIMSWKGDRIAAHNRWRRLMLFQYVPKANGRPVRLPIALHSYGSYYGKNPEYSTEAGQFKLAKAGHEMGADTYWFDAGWFPGEFPNGVGNWYPKPKEFPRGLKPIADWVHENGMKFILWFEPERVGKGTQIANEHPKFVFGGKEGGLYKLNDPAARRFMTDLLSKRITEYGVDIYRNDFNVGNLFADPLVFWRKNDTPDRQGMTEIRYVEGHYEMWDELLKKHPGLVIDNCASGGRRIDLETCLRSVPLWRSDWWCYPESPQEWNQIETAGLSQYIPLHTAGVWAPQAYGFRSAATAGVAMDFKYLAGDFPMEEARASVAELKENQKYWYGDFYLLSNLSAAPDQFVAYQFHRADLNEGLVLAFRHSKCNKDALTLGLQGLNPDTAYSVEYLDESRKKTGQNATGKELMAGTELRIPSQPGSLIVRYQPVRK